MTPPPKARRAPVETTLHGVTLVDDYAWLRDPGYPKVETEEILAHLTAENAHFEAFMAPHAALIDTLFEEMKGRIKEDDSSVPHRDGDWEYQWRFEEGGQYPVRSRRPVAGGAWAVLIDEPALAAGKEYFRLGGYSVSGDGARLAYATDTDGSERFVLEAFDIASGAALIAPIPNVSGGAVWSADGETLLYLELSPEWRPFRVRARRLSAPLDAAPEDDPILFEESDPGFFVSMGRTRSRAFIQLRANDHITSEVRLLPADDPFAAPMLVAPRRVGHEYDVEHRGDRLYVRTNDAHKNFRLATTPLDQPGEAQWETLIAGDDRVYLRGVAAFQDFVVLSLREDGLDQIEIHRDDAAPHRIAFPEAAYDAFLGTNMEFAPQTLRLGYTSMVTPLTVFDYHIADQRLETRKVQEVPSGYDPSGYETERLMITARDGVKVPVCVVHRRGFDRSGDGPLHLTAYASYGMGIQPNFSPLRLSLLDRGFAVALVQARGGDDLGFAWWEAGKAENRENTFHDIIDAAEALIALGYARAGRVSADGGSAGGQIMGAILNRAPTLWSAVVAKVPFVDVLNTMLDATLPLTPMEWPEWGDPITDPAAFARIRGYCPYQNVEAKAYPPLMVTAGLNDPRVTYWEPAKWTAKLRALKTDDNPLIFKTNMGAGHGGKSGRFSYLREVAEEFAFLLAAVDKTGA